MPMRMAVTFRGPWNFPADAGLHRPQVLPAIRVPWRPCIDGPQDGLSYAHAELQWEYCIMQRKHPSLA